MARRPARRAVKHRKGRWRGCRRGGRGGVGGARGGWVAANDAPEGGGRICRQGRLCEGNCVIEKGFDSVTIGSVEKYITETAFAKGWVKPPKPLRELDQSIGVIGAGPAGLAAAEQLRRKGYQVHVYDRYDRVGGLLVYRIPQFKLSKPAIVR